MTLQGNRDNSGMLDTLLFITLYLLIWSHLTSCGDVENEHDNTAATEHHDRVTVEKAKRYDLPGSSWLTTIFLGESNGLFVISILEDLSGEGNLVMCIWLERKSRSLLWLSRYNSPPSLSSLLSISIICPSSACRSLRNHNFSKLVLNINFVVRLKFNQIFVIAMCCVCLVISMTRPEFIWFWNLLLVGSSTKS